MIGKLLSLIFLFAFMINSCDALICYNCGYLELINGTKIPLTEEYEDIPFCEDFTSGDTNTVMAKIVRYTNIFYLYQLLFKL